MPLTSYHASSLNLGCGAFASRYVRDRLKSDSCHQLCSKKWLWLELRLVCLQYPDGHDLFKLGFISQTRETIKYGTCCITYDVDLWVAMLLVSTCTYRCMCTSMYLCIYIYMYIHVHTLVNIHMYIVYMYTNILLDSFRNTRGLRRLRKGPRYLHVQICMWTYELIRVSLTVCKNLHAQMKDLYFTHVWFTQIKSLRDTYNRFICKTISLIYTSQCKAPPSHWSSQEPPKAVLQEVPSD